MNKLHEELHKHLREAFRNHKPHVLAGLSLIVVVVHYYWPDAEVHATAVVGIICAECS